MLGGGPIGAPAWTGALLLRPGARLHPLHRTAGCRRAASAPGAEDLPGIVALGAAARDRRARRWPRGPTRMRALTDRLTRRACWPCADVRLNGHPDARIPGHVQVSAGWVEGESLCLSLAARGVAVSPGSACTAHGGKAAPALEAIGLEPPWTHSAVLFTLRAHDHRGRGRPRRRGLRRVGGRPARDEPADAVSARVVDALGTWCPVPIHLIDRAARRAAPGDVIELLADDPLIEVDLPAWCHRSGNDLLELRRDGDGYVGRVEITRPPVPTGRPDTPP